MDSWRHFHEGRAERVLLVSPELRVLFDRTPEEYDPIGLAREYLAGADIVLVEGFKRSPLPKIEVYRRAVAAEPIYQAGAPNADLWVAIVTDDHGFDATAGASLQRHYVASAPGESRLGARAGRRVVTAPLAAAEAARRILDEVRRQPALRMPLDDALDAVLAEDMVSPLDIPAWTNSAMDGYAVLGADVRGAAEERPVRLRVVEHLPAGRFPPASSTQANAPVSSPAPPFPTAPTPWCARRIPTRARTWWPSCAIPRRGPTSGARARTSGRGGRCYRSAPSSGRRSSACWRPSRSRILWSSASRGSPSSAAATRSWTWTSPRRFSADARPAAATPMRCSRWCAAPARSRSTSASPGTRRRVSGSTSPARSMPTCW